MLKGIENFINRMAGWPKEIDKQTVINRDVYEHLLATAASQDSGPLTLLPRFEDVAAAVERRTPNLAAAIRVEAVDVITDLLITTAGGGPSSGRAAETHAKLTGWLGDYPESWLPGALEARILLGTLEKFTKLTP